MITNLLLIMIFITTKGKMVWKKNWNRYFWKKRK